MIEKNNFIDVFKLGIFFVPTKKFRINLPIAWLIGFFRSCNVCMHVCMFDGAARKKSFGILNQIFRMSFTFILDNSIIMSFQVICKRNRISNWRENKAYVLHSSNGNVNQCTWTIQLKINEKFTILAFYKFKCVFYILCELQLLSVALR